MLAFAVAVPFVIGGLVIWGRATTETIKKLGASIVAIAIFTACVMAMLDMLPRLLAQ